MCIHCHAWCCACHQCVLCFCDCYCLQRALPQLAPLMWDSSPRVREAMTDLLLCIS